MPTTLQELCDELSEGAQRLGSEPEWPSEQIAACRNAGVFRWFVPETHGGWGYDEQRLLDGYLALSQSCLTTTFILTQWVAACRRIVGSSNDALRERLLPRLADGSLFATVGISHLTTSRQHVAPVMQATEVEGGYRLNGFSPWVTAAPAADVVVLGATLPDGKQLIAAVPTDRPGVQPSGGQRLVALSCSCTDRIDLEDVELSSDEVLAGPVENVMKTNSGGGAGGLQTSTLAVGLSLAATNFLLEQAEVRGDLLTVAEKLQSDANELRDQLRRLTLKTDSSRAPGIAATELRRQANSLVLRATQAALSAAKGAGFVAGHPTGAWAQQALFFLVWSCPQDVVNANLCELAQLEPVS
ncbi:MAG TPA: acyl-CoA dehydrogenase [Planctomycetaceae bacterium]|nr:acyl-CoA dehydrogenase [Planctomycetaceae bacterium]